MFGRRKQQQQAQEEAAREAERRAVFEELAKRPDTICPFLGLDNARTEYRDRVSDGHRCYAFGDPAELSAEQQQKVCLQRGYGNCPRYLRGVLVIPTEELEALRRPQPLPPPPVAAAPEPAPQQRGRGRGRGGLVAVLLMLLIAVAGGVGGFVILNLPGGVALETPTPSPSVATPVPSEGPASVAPTSTPEPTPEPTPIVVPSSEPDTIPVLPTPGPDDTSTGYAVFVLPGTYPVLNLAPDGTVLSEERAVFDNVSAAPVQPTELDDGLFWRTLLGGYTGYAYNRDLSGEGFYIFETYETDDGEARFRELDEDEY